MTIKEVSEKYKISEPTIRYYEKVGLIPYVNRQNGIRNFEEKDLKTLEFVLCLRNAGLSIDSILKYISLTDEGDETLKERITILESEKKELQRKRNEIDEFIEHLNYKINLFKTKLS